MQNQMVLGMGTRMTQNEQTGKRRKQGLNHQIDENLKRVYESALQEDVPDRFKDLLNRLREQEGGK
jgi:biotin-(acetyl-CoA carboxylase) ligase